jgi:uncharacterized protein (TIGR03086 family)
VDVRELVRRASSATGAVIARIGGQDWQRPTPCSEWTVRDIVEHLVANNRRNAAQARGQAPAQDNAVDGDLAGAFADSADACMAAIAPEDVLDREFDLGRVGMLPGRVALSIHFADTLVHGWDLAVARGEEHRLDDSLAEVALRITSKFPDAPHVRGDGAAFAQPVEAHAGAGPGERLLAWLGRDPSAWPAEAFTVRDRFDYEPRAVPRVAGR